MEQAPKHIQKCFIKAFKKLNILEYLQPIDWSAPIELFISHIDTILTIFYIDGYIILNSNLNYKNNINKNWKIFNELGNPEYQPSILMYIQEEKKQILVWSKESIASIGYEDICEWIELFIYMVEKVQLEIIEQEESSKKSTKSTISNTYEFLEKML